MPTDRVGVVLAAMARVDGRAASVVDRVCVASVGLLGVTGSAISLMVQGRLQGSAGASDSTIAVVQELQLELGEGPCGEAWWTEEPVLEADLAVPVLERWPAFARAALDAGVRAVFAFPLHQGAIRIGVLVLYRDRAGELSSEQWADGVVVADVASQVVLAVQAGAPADEVHELLADEPPHWAQVHQATGMISVQLGVSMDEAFVRLRAHAFAHHRPLRDVTLDVVAGRLHLDG